MVRDDAGAVRRAEGTMQDVTELVQAEVRLRNILDGLSIRVTRFDLAGRPVEGNRTPSALEDISRPARGQAMWDAPAFSHSAAMRDLLRAMFAQAAGGTPARGELVVRSDQGHLRTIDATLAPIRDAAGRIEGVVGSAVDITERVQAETAVRESEARFAAAFHGNPIAMGLRRLRDDTVLEVNEGFERLTGVPREDAVGRAAGSLGIYADPSARRAITEKADWSEPIRDLDVKIRARSGQIRHVLMTAAPIRVGGEDCLLGSYVDVTARKEAEAVIRERDAHLAAVFENTTDAMMLLSADTDELRVTAANRACFERFGRVKPVDASDMVGATFDEVAQNVAARPREALAQYHEAFRRVIDTRAPVAFEHTLDLASGTLYAEVTLVPIFDAAGTCAHILWSSHDVTARRAAEAQLRASLAEKETLLREIHHRVKNNLQVVSSLLHFHGKKTAPADREALRDLRQRISAMSLVHERLYQSRDVSRVELGDYVRRLVEELQRSLGRREGVRLEVAADELELPMELAMPAGLIVSELVTNVLKHAFPGSRTGVATVTVRREAEEIVLCVEDDGVGFPEGFDPLAAGSFGWELVRTLALQLRAKLETKTVLGLHVCLTFARPQQPQKGGETHDPDLHRRG